MTIRSSSASLWAVLVLAAACSSAAPPPDIRPLGDVTAFPRECDLISSTAVKIATGFTDYIAVGTKMDKGRFASCSVAEDLTSEGKLGLVIEVHEPPPVSPEGLENTKVTNQGHDLPPALGPGFSARREDADDESTAFVYGWTPDHERLLSVEIMHGAPGRDSLGDAVEFFRQLKPVLLASSR